MSAAVAVKARPARDVRPVASSLADHDTDYLLECLDAWWALSPDCAQAGEIEAELLDRGVAVEKKEAPT